MPRFISFETFNMMDQRPDGSRMINVDHVTELIGQNSYNSKPLTRIKLVNNETFDVLKNIDEVKRELEG